MEFNKMEALLEKYFEGETSIAEDNELKDYFSSSNVAPHLEQYRPLFGYFTEAKGQKFTNELPLVSKKRKVAWLSIAASVVVLIGVGTYTYFNANTVKENKELGTYNDPREALEATQKALAMLSNHVNVGVEGVQYLQVYEVTKDKVFVE
jgi:predicted ribosomally synthesized peptide with SipW-like signal peptide